jgi:hypothetical protein
MLDQSRTYLCFLVCKIWCSEDEFDIIPSWRQSSQAHLRHADLRSKATGITCESKRALDLTTEGNTYKT